MISCSSKRFALLSLVVVSLTLPGRVFGIFETFSVGGSDAASIQPTVDAFRAALGDPNNMNAPGPIEGGRREINWDGGGDTTTISPTPFTGFLNNRGALFTTPTPGTGFIQAPPSGGPQGGFATFFGDPSLGDLEVFSPLRLFSPIDSNITDVSFFIPGTNGGQPATVSGFGAIFSDVDLPNTTSIQFFDINNNMIFSQNVLPQPVGVDNGLSFLGALGLSGEEIFRVRITSGNAPIGSAESPLVDTVAMDDFLYGEPQAVPESGAGIGLIGLGLGLVLLCHRRSLAIC
jgi:hypothetical protein